ncbi:hypothetical protein [uncultured Shimia sp.]|uniref:hypothetical protein n=1 Tax=uncultured Shimia sp. TaxID=573152 RepID=UPI002613F52D|nr:hypothetical protein [uncultured Shimia sp.]
MTNGFIFAVSGPDYAGLAQQAAATVAQHHPDIPIDLFTDQPCDDPVFTQVHQLSGSSPRPRFEALLQSRFDNTICLDADLFVIAPIADVFALLQHFDIAAAHDQRLNVSTHTLVFHTKPVPTAFPQYNSGVFGLRKSDETHAFVRAWEAGYIAADLGIDQPILRELLFESRLRIATLPAQYNVIDMDLIRSFDSRTIAPRILHSSLLRTGYKRDVSTATTPEDLVGKDFMQFLRDLQEADVTLTPKPIQRVVEAYCDTRPGTKVHPQNNFTMKYSKRTRLRRWWAELKVPFIDT